jgi:hypothetical protein
MLKYIAFFIRVNKKLQKTFLTVFSRNEETKFLFRADERRSHLSECFKLIRKFVLLIFEKIRCTKRWILILRQTR